MWLLRLIIVVVEVVAMVVVVTPRCRCVLPMAVVDGR